MSKSHWGKKDSGPRTSRKEIAEGTLKAIEEGCYVLNGVKHDLQSCTHTSTKGTRYYAANSLLSTWKRPPQSTSCSPSTGETPKPIATEISILEMTTLKGARYLSVISPHPGKIAVLNFASAKKPGGGFLTGASAQEESIARSSNLYPSLMTDTGQSFYLCHKKDPKDGFYSHAMIYTPAVALFRDDDGTWLEPIFADVVTSAAVNAGSLRDSHTGQSSLTYSKKTGKLSAKPASSDELEADIENEMRERMARILFVCENANVRNLVLGSFGTGVFRNKVEVVARLWAELLTHPDARFKHSFKRVVFAIMDQRTLDRFQGAFDTQKEEVDEPHTSSSSL